MEELLLWRWSTAVQITSAVLFAAFLVALLRAVPRPETRWWAAAYVANLGAMAVTVAYWYGVPEFVPTQLTRFGYMAAKTAFVVGVLAGVLAFRHPEGLTPFTPRRWIGFSAAVGLIGAFGTASLADLGLAQQSVVAAALGLGAWHCLRRSSADLIWLGFGLGLRALLAAGEATAYGLQAFGSPLAETDALKFALAAHSSFDTGAEWLILLGCVVAVARRSESELRRSHAELHRANLALIDAVQRDPLTGLANRRALAPLLEVAGRNGATLVFLDLDDFKAVNDLHGHDVGDACLRRFADALRRHFGEADGLVRYAGDEFLIVDARMARDEIERRVDALRIELAVPLGAVPALGFSVGLHRSGSGRSDAKTALREADQAMYRDKAERRSRPRPEA